MVLAHQLAVAGVVLDKRHFVGGLEGVDFAETDVAAHILPAELVAAGQVPVVFQQQGFGFGVGVVDLAPFGEHFGHVGHQRGGAQAFFIGTAGFVAAAVGVNRVVAIAAGTGLAGIIVAFAAVAVGGQAVGNIGFEGGCTLPIAVAAETVVFAARVFKAALVEYQGLRGVGAYAAKYIVAVGGGADGQGAVVVPAEPAGKVVLGLDGVVGLLGGYLKAPFAPFGHDVGGFDGADDDRAAHAGFHAACEGGAFLHRDAAEQGGV